MLPWSFFALRMTAKKCVSPGTSQRFVLRQASQRHIILTMESVPATNRRSIAIRGLDRRLRPLDTRIKARYTESSIGQLSGNIHLPDKLWGLRWNHFLYIRNPRHTFIGRHVVFHISVIKQVCVPAAG